MSRKPSSKEISKKKCPDCGSVGNFIFDARERPDGKESLICEYCGNEWNY